MVTIPKKKITQKQSEINNFIWLVNARLTQSTKYEYIININQTTTDILVVGIQKTMALK